MDTSSMYSIKGIVILDNDGERVLCSYYDEQFPTFKEQRAFEKKLFDKTARANSEIVMFDGLTCVYRSNIDLFFYVIGSSSENELLLASILASYYEAIAITLRETVEKATFMERLDSMMLITDAIADRGIVLELDPDQLASVAAKKVKDEPLSEQSISKALNKAGGLLRKHLLA